MRIDGTGPRWRYGAKKLRYNLFEQLPYRNDYMCAKDGIVLIGKGLSIFPYLEKNEDGYYALLLYPKVRVYT